tara:strand:- start:341 stop:580 length:240 start_codon:yes stop_codon:yes gene_type:complete
VDSDKKITISQSKAARSFLNWNQQDLADKVGCAKKTITDFEKGNREPQPRTIKEIKRVFEENGIKFINNGEIGVKIDNN